MTKHYGFNATVTFNGRQMEIASMATMCKGMYKLHQFYLDRNGGRGKVVHIADERIVFFHESDEDTSPFTRCLSLGKAIDFWGYREIVTRPKTLSDCAKEGDFSPKPVKHHFYSFVIYRSPDDKSDYAKTVHSDGSSFVSQAKALAKDCILWPEVLIEVTV